MYLIDKSNTMTIADKLNKNQVGVMPADTVYGIFGKANNTTVIRRIYDIKKRDLSKPVIVLINDIADLESFDVAITSEIAEKLQKIWPNKVTVILPTSNKNVPTMAFRLPKDGFLREVLKMTGPLVSTSANISGEKTVTTVLDAGNLFREEIDFYVDGGKIEGLPSTVVELKDGNLQVVRQGDVLSETILKNIS